MILNAYAALLRAINVGGTGKLSMADLRALCENCGFTDVTTYIQSGNVVFRSKLDEAGTKQLLEQSLTEKMGKPFGVLLRSASELSDLLEHNPFPDALPNRVNVYFLDAPAPADMLERIKPPAGEEVIAKGRDIFVHYPNGQGESKFLPPFARIGTGRNLNTVRKMHALLTELEAG